MDTSSDFSSPTYDFLSGIGTNFPKPTSEEYARRLLAIGERLHWQGGALRYIVGNKPVKDHWWLKDAITLLPEERAAAIRSGRATELRDPRSEVGGVDLARNIRSRVYIGYTRTEVFWLLTTELDSLHGYPDGTKRLQSCVELDVHAMTEFFRPSEHWATPLPVVILQLLSQLVKIVLDGKRLDLQRLEKECTLLDQDRQLFASAREIPRPPVDHGFFSN